MDAVSKLPGKVCGNHRQKSADKIKLPTDGMIAEQMYAVNINHALKKIKEYK